METFTEKGIVLIRDKDLPILEKFILDKLYKKYQKRFKFKVSIAKYPGGRLEIEIYDLTNIKKSELGRNFANFSLSEFPGCCGILVSHNMYIHSDWQNRHLWDTLHDIKIELAKLLNYTMLMATTRTSNLIENYKLMSNKWRFINESKFVNKRTDNEIVTWIKDI